MFIRLNPIKKLIARKTRVNSAARRERFGFRKREAIIYVAVEEIQVIAITVKTVSGVVKNRSPAIAKRQTPNMINFVIIFSTCNLLYDAL